jgi:hypothetical protein
VKKLFFCILFFFLDVWFIGFIFHEMAFGLLSVFLPLYITGTLKGSLSDVGIMIAGANFIAVPFSFFWGISATRQGDTDPSFCSPF